MRPSLLFFFPIPGILKHNFTLGYGHKWEKIVLDVAAQFSVSDSEFVDNSEIVGGDFDNSSIKTKATLLLFGLKYFF